jgi:hypothetical protein
MWHGALDVCRRETKLLFHFAFESYARFVDSAVALAIKTTYVQLEVIALRISGLQSIHSANLTEPITALDTSCSVSARRSDCIVHRPRQHVYFHLDILSYLSKSIRSQLSTSPNHAEFENAYICDR